VLEANVDHVGWRDGSLDAKLRTYERVRSVVIR
jgi:hypothetical protein